MFHVAYARPPLKPTREVSQRMRRVAVRGTEPEARVLRIVKQLRIRHTTRTSALPGRPDLVFPIQRVAVFVHGCFWHGCPRCYTEPKRNRVWWREKIAANKRRDRRKADQLRRIGYRVVTLWEHDDDARVAKRLAAVAG